ncbi:phospholipase D-like domain-containing protein [uncultured Methanofollis sp.]|uniref:phospholipase D-like domain-containing protein n=1 Tax=uncultured Methanofollis sp. TaxID=262500 RepID=UPI002629F0D0|nr:phospholipase D-like domain-containing protein [uncultured Methanofollis sp.]
MSMRTAIVILLLALFAGTAGAFQIVAFCPDTYLTGEPDEYFVLEGSGSPGGIEVTDGEGSVRFPEGSTVNGRVVVAREAAGYLRAHGSLPDYEVVGTDATVPDMLRRGDFRLANQKDSITLIVGGAVVQEVGWPEDVAARQGQVHTLVDGGWDPRPFFIGQSDFAPRTFENVTVTLFVSPDCSYEVLSEAVASARERIDVNVYEFTHPGIAEMLAGAAGRGVDVSVLVEGGPVGGISAEEKGVARMLADHGVTVMMMETAGDAHARYRFDHAKYMVVDGRGVLVTSENFKESGIPETGEWGNRGWGAWVEDAGVAGYFAEVYRADCTGGDIVPAPQGGGLAETGGGGYEVRFAPETVHGARVTPVLAPDTSGLVRQMIAGAEERVLIEQAYITNSTVGGANRYLAEAINASRRGVAVQVLLDSAWFNVEGEKDNDEMAAWINGLARREGIPMEARCIDLAAAGLEKVHTKGVVVDNRSVLVSSINWNDNSPDFNREAGVIIEHPAAAAYFARTFAADWEAGTRAGGDAGFDYRIIAALGVVVLFAAVYVARRVLWEG